MGNVAHEVLAGFLSLYLNGHNIIVKIMCWISHYLNGHNIIVKKMCWMSFNKTFPLFLIIGKRTYSRYILRTRTDLNGCNIIVKIMCWMSINKTFPLFLIIGKPTYSRYIIRTRTDLNGRNIFSLYTKNTNRPEQSARACPSCCEPCDAESLRARVPAPSVRHSTCRNPCAVSCDPVSPWPAAAISSCDTRPISFFLPEIR